MARGVVWCLAVVFGVGGFSGCLDDGGSLSLDRPLWASGYSFAYERTGDFFTEEVYSGGDESGDRSERDSTGPDTYLIEILNTTLRNGDVPVYLGALALPSTEPSSPSVVSNVALVAYRQRDLAGVSAWAEFQATCPVMPNEPAPPCQAPRAGNVMFGPDPEATYLDFPLAKGKTWERETDDAMMGLGDGLDWKIEAKVGSATTVDLPMGSARALPVEFKFAPLNLEEFIQEVLEEEKEDGLESFRFRPYQSLKLFYSADYETVVRSERVTRLDVEMSGKDDEGNPVSSKAHYEARIEQKLVGARLVALPERGLDYIGQVLSGKIQLNDPTGQARKPAGYMIEVEPSASILNAAETPTLKFEAKIIGDPVDFQGHSARWRLLDFVGNEIAAGEGLEGSRKIEEPGYYTIEFETRDADDQVTAGASAFVVANYEATVRVACPVVGGLALPDCDPVTVPVRPGVQELTVGALVSAPVAAAHRGTLTLSDQAGREWSRSAGSPGSYEIRFDDFSAATVGEQDWLLDLEQFLGVAETVEYQVKLVYGAPTEAPIEEASGSGAGAPAAPLPWDLDRLWP